MGKQKRADKAAVEKIRTMAEEWELYREAIIPPQATEGQIATSKNSFYAGAYVAQSLIIQSSTLLSEEIAETKLTELLEETKKQLGVK